MKTWREPGRRTPSPARIVPVEARHLAACEAFIATREWACVPLSEKFIAFKSEKRAGSAESEFFMLEEGEANAEAKIAGVLFLSRGGNVLHCLSPSALESKTWKRELRSFFKGKKIASIAGEREANRFLEKVCCALFFNKTDFIFMRRLRAGDEALTSKGACAAGRSVHVCSEKDANELLPLQMAYEVEELEMQGDEAASGKALMRLKGILRRQTVLACRDESTGKLVGKAGTNAKGKEWNQIGGVYTAPECRNKGIAQFMIAELVRLSAAEGKDAVLFVKPKNKAAQAAYGKSGFTECGWFRVAAK